MQLQIKLSETIQRMLRCPICEASLELYNDRYQCKNPRCNFLFPIMNGIPILINEARSIFSIADFVRMRETTFYSPQTKIERVMRRFIPDISRNIKGKENFKQLGQLLLSQSDTPRVLVVGGSILGSGMEALLEYPNIELAESDVTFGPRTVLICDAHNLPFEAGSFDGVVVQAVLEHVVDPWQCVVEIHRVLKEGGLVYAETPFMQQVHGGRYDFTRFTHLGHRRLFRKFEEVDSGALCGPAMALAWSCKYFLTSFTTHPFLRRLIGTFARYAMFSLTYLDYFLIDKPGTLDSASAYYFLGRKGNGVLPDRELVRLYRGLDQT